MKGLTHALAVLLFTGAVARGADTLKPPPMTGPEERGAVVTKTKNGTVRWRAEWTMARAQANGRAAVKMTESGQGMYSGFTQPVRWNIEAWWSAADVFRPLRFEKTVTDLAGKLLAREEKQFDWTKNEARFERHDARTDERTRKIIPLPGETLAVEGIAGALRALPFERGLRFQTHLMTNEPKLYDITLELRGRETIRTAAGTFDCYKIELVPHVGALNAFRFLFPKSYFWFTVESPHTWVRYQGPESGASSPEITMERAE